MSCVREDPERIHSDLGYHRHAIHTGPLIRRESVYANDMMEQRKHLFNILFYFTRRLDIHYICACVKKSECEDAVDMTAKLSRSIALSLTKQTEFFSSYDRIIVYYDNGQVELTKIITTLFATRFLNVEFRKVRPVDYKLFQVADLVCTAELLAIKAGKKAFSKSETEFFHSIKDFKKEYLKAIQSKKI